MTFDAISNILYTRYKFQKTFKNGNLTDGKKSLEQFSHGLMNHLSYAWG